MTFTYRASEDRKSLIMAFDYDGQLYELATAPPHFEVLACFRHLFSNSWGLVSLDELPTGLALAIGQELRKAKKINETKNSKPSIKPASPIGPSTQPSAKVASGVGPPSNYRRLSTGL